MIQYHRHIKSIFIRIGSHLSYYESMKDQPNPAIQDLQIDGINIIRTSSQVGKVLEILDQNRDRIHCWDTETVDIQVKE